MKKIEIIDKYNYDKVWIIKKYKSGHYYINQQIKDKLFYKKFQQCTKKYLLSIGLDV